MTISDPQPLQAAPRASPEDITNAPAGSVAFFEPGMVELMLNQLYQSGELGELSGMSGTSAPIPPPQGGLDPSGIRTTAEAGVPMSGNPQGIPLFPALWQTVPDPDRANPTPQVPFGLPYRSIESGKLEDSTISRTSPKPLVEIPAAMPTIPTTQAWASGNPALPNVLPGGSGVSDGVALIPSSETPVASTPGEMPTPSPQPPAVLAPPTGGTPTYLPPLQAAPNIAGDPVGLTRQTAAAPAVGIPQRKPELPQEPTAVRAPITDTALAPDSLLRELGRPYFLAPEAISGGNLPEPEVHTGREFLPQLPEFIPSVEQFAPLPTTTPELGSLYFLKGQPPPSVIDEPRSDREYDLSGVRADFPLLHQRVNGRPLVWLDNAATSQKPRAVIEAIKQYYETINSNVHRGAHTLAARATEAYEGARERVQKFIGADSPEEIVFTRGATEAINLVANSYGRKFFAPGDEVIVTVLEHHSNIVPWMMLKESLGIKIKVAPVDDNGDLIFSEYAKLFSPRTRLAAFTHVANSIGTVMPVREMTALAHLNGVKVLIDGAQSIPHFRVNVRSIDADFYIFAGHKVFGPTGIGVLYGKKALLEVMPPWQGGGSMIDQVTFDEVTYNAVPHKFEAGTPSIAEAVGLGAALDYLTQIGFERASAYESSLMGYALRALESLPGIRLIGHPLHRAGSISLVLDGIDTEAVGKFLDKEGIAVRAGHHCAQPSLARFGLQRTVRPSLAIYNTVGEINRLVEALLKAQRELKA